MNVPTKIVLADDYPLFLEGMRLMLSNEPNIAIAGEASNGEELIRCVAEQQPDIVITDIEMPVMNGIEATTIIRQQHPGIGILALTMFNDNHLIVDMMEAGANGYLLKNTAKAVVLDAIATVRKGLNYFSNETSMQLFKKLAKSKLQQEQDAVVFTEKETEIMRLICEQYASKQIATLTNLSKRTVDKYRDHIMEKTGSTNLAGVVIFAIRNGYFKP